MCLFLYVFIYHKYICIIIFHSRIINRVEIDILSFFFYPVVRINYKTDEVNDSSSYILSVDASFVQMCLTLLSYAGGNYYYYYYNYYYYIIYHLEYY